MKDKDNTEENTVLVLRGATYEEALALVDHIDVTGLSIPEMQQIIDPIVEKYGWTTHKLLLEAIKRSDVE